MVQVIMNKLVIIAFIIRVIVSQCAAQCLTCQTNNNPYNCLSCYPDNSNIYFFSCPTPSSSTTPFLIIAAFLTFLHLFMLFVGIGIYRDIFQNLQLGSLICWRYGFDGGSSGMQLTNLAIVSNNSFPDTFGPQFIVVMCVLGVFWLLLILVDRIPHNPTAILLRRKKIIFPIRIITFIFNILLYSSLLQLTTVPTEINFQGFAFVLAILGVIKVIAVLIGIAVTSNWKRFQVDDPHYYVFLEQMVSKKWYAKNSVLISLVFRAIMIISFTTLFSQPYLAGIIILNFQIIYAIYIVALIRFTKLRYYVFIVTGNILLIGIFAVSFIGAVEQLYDPIWNNLSIAYIVLLMMLAGLFFFVTMIEIVARRDIILKQLRSFYNRFIICQKDSETVLMNKYDENSHRERVTQFKSNLLYHRPISNAKSQDIQLTSSFKRTPS